MGLTPHGGKLVKLYWGAGAGPTPGEGLNMGSSPDQKVSRLRAARELAGHVSVHRQRMEPLAVTLC